MPCRDLNKLHPVVEKKAKQHIQLCKNNGIKLLIYNTLRTYQQQDDLYAMGRTKPGAIVTWAVAGKSFHNFALAYDSVAIVNNKCVWSSKDPVWIKIGELGKSLGMEWGGDWSGKKKDRPHFQFSGGFPIQEIRQKYENGEELFPQPVKSIPEIKIPEVIEDQTNFLQVLVQKVVNFFLKFV